MQIEEHLYLMKLFDVYGKLLSEKQQFVMDKFLNFDIGESELAEMQGESRQSIHDAINKAKKQLYAFEEKCGFIEKTAKIERNLEKIKALLQNNQVLDANLMIDDILK